jgi:succinate dehydrogenase / fumarate reductase flavoprotein subunit
VWSPRDGVVRESIPAIPKEIDALMREVSQAGKLLE